METQRDIRPRSQDSSGSLLLFRFAKRTRPRRHLLAFTGFIRNLARCPDRVTRPLLEVLRDTAGSLAKTTSLLYPRVAPRAHVSYNRHDAVLATTITAISVWAMLAVPVAIAGRVVVRLAGKSGYARYLIIRRFRSCSVTVCRRSVTGSAPYGMVRAGKGCGSECAQIVAVHRFSPVIDKLITTMSI